MLCTRRDTLCTDVRHRFRVSRSFSRQMNSISSVFGVKVTSTVVPYGRV